MDPVMNKGELQCRGGEEGRVWVDKTIRRGIGWSKVNLA